MREIEPYDAFGLFKPEWCVFVITTDKKNGRASGMVAGWSMKCSREPPLYAVALGKRGYTNKIVRESGEFVIAVPNKTLEPAIRIFGRMHGDVVDKFKESGLRTEKAKLVSVPILTDATINLECKVEKEVETGDHYVFIGKVVAAHVNPGKKFLMNVGKRTDGWYDFQEF